MGREIAPGGGRMDGLGDEASPRPCAVWEGSGGAGAGVQGWAIDAGERKDVEKRCGGEKRCSVEMR